MNSKGQTLGTGKERIAAFSQNIPSWMQETSAWGWCTGTTQKDGIGMEVEGGSGWGTHVNP